MPVTELAHSPSLVFFLYCSFHLFWLNARMIVGPISRDTMLALRCIALILVLLFVFIGRLLFFSLRLAHVPWSMCSWAAWDSPKGIYATTRYSWLFLKFSLRMCGVLFVVGSFRSILLLRFLQLNVLSSFSFSLCVRSLSLSRSVLLFRLVFVVVVFFFVCYLFQFHFLMRQSRPGHSNVVAHISRLLSCQHSN